jgi:MinD-like ATPase involved in chromosome partitioning or flagellar assembly
VLIACWSPKGGSGTTVVTCALALTMAAHRPAAAPGMVLADLAGDVPAVLGIPAPAGPGLAEWLAAGSDVAVDALTRLEVDATPGLRLLPWTGPSRATESAPVAAGGQDRGDVLATLLGADPRLVVVDCGHADSGAGLAVAAGADVSLLVLRPCYLALRLAMAAPIRPSGVILVTEPGRAVTRHDVEDVLGVPVRAEIDHDAAVARAVDAGLLATRVPRSLQRALRAAA